MSLSAELAALFRRDLTRLLQELRAVPGDADLWRTLPGVTNSIGHLTMHLEGNLREYAGRQLAGIPYVRNRDREFAGEPVALDALINHVEELSDLVHSTVAALSQTDLEAHYPEKVWGMTITTQQFLIHLHGHLNYHLGQIDYLRRALTRGSAVPFVGL